MALIDWQRCVLNLRVAGFSCATVARKIGRDESLVQRIARGDAKRINFDDGLRLLDLHFDACPDKHKGLRT